MTEETPDHFIETRVDIPSEQAELVCDFIVENITNGLVLEEEEDSGVTGIIFYVPSDHSEQVERLTDFIASLPGSGVKPKLQQREVKGQMWLEEYRQSIKPLRIGDDIVVRPTWVETQGATYEIVIEPKMAFGTGSHATTRSSMLAIRRHFQSGMTFLDMGCGSGILGILADKLGATYIKAVDYDPVSVENSLENFQINEVTTKNDIALGSIEQCDYDQPYDFVCANIIRETILSMLDRLVKLTLPGGVLVLSGMLEKDTEEITPALQALGQEDFDIIHDEEWRTYVVQTSTER